MNIVICRRADRLALTPIFVEMNDYYFGDNSISVAEMTSFLEHHLFSEFSGVTVACCRDENGTIVGVTTFSLMYPAPYATGQIYMKELFVTASARGMGVGQALLSYVARFAIQHGCSRLDWTAETKNSKAVAFYRSMGARELDEKIYFRLDSGNLQYLADRF